jgi:hypothetical protein
LRRREEMKEKIERK